MPVSGEHVPSVEAVESVLVDLTRRIRPEARWVRATVFLDLGRTGAFGFHLDSGRAAVTAEPPVEPDVTVRTSASTIVDVLTARRPGYEAFLDGEIEIRGNLSLALELESLFTAPRPLPDPWPQTLHVKAGRNRWSILRAGPPDAVPLLLFHGLGATKASFLSTVRELSADHRVFACDLPGFGDSSKPIARYDAPWFAARVVELLDALQIERALLMGNSMGGRIAIEVGLTSPDRCLGVVALAPALAFLRFRQLAPVVRFLPSEFGFLPVRPTRRIVLNVLRSVFVYPQRIPDHWFEAATDEFFRVWSKARGRRAFVAAARNIYLDEPHGEAGFWMRLATLQVPSQFVFGRDDPLIPVSFATHVANALPEAGIAILDDCGHVPQLEEPDAVHLLTRKFTAGLG